LQALGKFRITASWRSKRRDRYEVWGIHGAGDCMARLCAIRNRIKKRRHVETTCSYRNTHQTDLRCSFSSCHLLFLKKWI